MSRQNRYNPATGLRTDRVPSQQQQQRISDAVHAAACAFLGTDGTGGCQWYARAALRLLDSLGYSVVLQSGVTTIRLGEQGDYVRTVSLFSPHQNEENYHVWIGVNERYIVDFALRHFKPTALRLGSNWDTADLPDWYWLDTTPQSFDWLQKYGITYEPTLEACRAMDEHSVVLRALDRHVGDLALQHYRTGECHATADTIALRAVRDAACAAGPGNLMSTTDPRTIDLLLEV